MMTLKWFVVFPLFLCICLSMCQTIAQTNRRTQRSHNADDLPSQSKLWQILSQRQAHERPKVTTSRQPLAELPPEPSVSSTPPPPPPPPINSNDVPINRVIQNPSIPAQPPKKYIPAKNPNDDVILVKPGGRHTATTLGWPFNVAFSPLTLPPGS